jgi:hypothetical protein
LVVSLTGAALHQLLHDVQLDVAPARHGGAPLAAPVERLEARQQLVEREGLGEVVVAHAQPADAVGDGVTGAQEEDRLAEAGLAQVAAEEEAGLLAARQHHVEHCDVEGLAPGELPRLLAVAGEHDAVPLCLQALAQGGRQGDVVFDEQDAHALPPPGALWRPGYERGMKPP